MTAPWSPLSNSLAARLKLRQMVMAEMPFQNWTDNRRISRPGPRLQRRAGFCHMLQASHRHLTCTLSSEGALQHSKPLPSFEMTIIQGSRDRSPSTSRSLRVLRYAGVLRVVGDVPTRIDLRRPPAKFGDNFCQGPRRTNFNGKNYMLKHHDMSRSVYTQGAASPLPVFQQ